MKVVGKAYRKKDAMQLVTGKPVYTDDLKPNGCLVVKLLRSPHAHALVKEIKKDIALKVPGIVCILGWEDVPRTRFTLAGQTYPELSPYDHAILDQRLRCVGDPVAIVAGETEEAVDRAMKLIKVTYEVLEPVLDYTKALDHPVVVHPEDDYQVLVPSINCDQKRNLITTEHFEHGDVEAQFKECTHIVEHTYHVRAVSQAMMETFRAYCYHDLYGRLVCVSSTQVPFHVRRVLSNALKLKKSDIRVIKPRIGGGFGAKQSVVCEMFPAVVTHLTGRPAEIIYTREESMTNGSPRHEMSVTVKLGCGDDGILKAMSMYTLSNGGAYAEHSPTTVGLSGHKGLSLYGTPKAYRFDYDVVYSNTMGTGAYRGYGATQGEYAVECAISELAEQAGFDPITFRKLNMVREGQIMPAYYGELCQSNALDRCLDRVCELIGWDEKYPAKRMENGKIRAVGVALAMQGSSISQVDEAAVELRLNEDGNYHMLVGSADMGTGSDTTLAQVAAEALECELDDIAVFGVDTDASPYDSGSYASSTAYLTGRAAYETAMELRKKMIHAAAGCLGIDEADVLFDGKTFSDESGLHSMTLRELGVHSLGGFSGRMLSASVSRVSPVSPPPFMAGAVEIEVDPETGKVEILQYKAAVDCGTVLNPNIARGQTEGGLVQGIGMTLFEDVQFTDQGKLRNNSFMQYKIPTRLDCGDLEVVFESSYEPEGPYGAKSIGEVVINTPAPALTNAIYNATGLRFYELPIKAEQIALGLLHRDER